MPREKQEHSPTLVNIELTVPYHDNNDPAYFEKSCRVSLAITILVRFTVSREQS